ncbi:thioester domain-containing protein [Mycobacterium sp. 050134]|uniref:thioester domain-containing protein n=1 Tax=Mycobacterium sp. 050134 TaxID=3096111 RepID=UPI002ED80B85
MTVLSLSSRSLTRVATHRRVLVRPATHVPLMTRYRGGTYSHTVDTVVFADGSRARTDLIRLNPNLHAYSLDFTGIAPRHPSRYALGSWSTLSHLRTRRHEAQVDWILRHSFPMRPTAELSQRLRAAGHPLGHGNISEHEAIAATQAAIWHFTNGLILHTRPLNVPVAVRRRPDSITFEFDGEPQLGGYAVWTESDASIGMKLQKSANGIGWQDVSGSQLAADAGRGHYRRPLGVGSTVSASRHGRAGRGYRFYRLVTTTGYETAAVGHVDFWLTGSRHYRNPDRVVHLYNYLLSGACNARENTEELRLVDDQASAEAELIGPFQVPIPLTLSVSAGHTLVDADGVPVVGLVEPGTGFYLRPAPGTSATTLTATPPHHLTGHVLTGVASDGSAQRLTPIALTVPANVAVEFDITWQPDESCSDLA